MTMLSFYNKQELKNEYVERVKAHERADEIVQGVYWESGKGCAVGCTIHGRDHSKYKTVLGLPVWLAHLEDTLFEGLSRRDAKRFPRRFLEAVPVGVSEESFEQLRKDFLIYTLKAALEQESVWREHDKKDEYVSQVVAAIKGVISALRGKGDLEKARSAARFAARFAARSAAESAESAAWSATWSATWSAESAARSATRFAARSAARFAAWSAAESASYKRLSEYLIRKLKKLPTTKEAGL